MTCSFEAKELCTQASGYNVKEAQKPHYSYLLNRRPRPVLSAVKE